MKQVKHALLSLPNIFLVIMSIIIMLMLEQFTLYYFQDTLSKPAFAMVAYGITPLLHDITILSILYFFIFYTTKKYDIKYFLGVSLLAMLLPTLDILLRIFDMLNYFMALDLFSIELLLSARDISMQFSILQLPLIILASSFLINCNYKTMKNVSIITLIISINMAMYIFLYEFNSNLLFHLYISRIYIDELYLLSFFIFTLGLFKDYKDNLKPEAYIERNRQYVYPSPAINGFSKYFSTSGRAARGEFWTFSVLLGLFYAVGMVLLAERVINSTVLLMLVAVGVIMQINMNTKRLHDIGISGWYQTIILIPIIGPLVLLWRYLQPTPNELLTSQNTTQAA